MLITLRLYILFIKQNKAMKILVFIGLIFCLGCNKKFISGEFRLRNGFNQELYPFIKHSYIFDSKTSSFNFSMIAHFAQLNSSGLYKQNKNYIILNSIINTNYLPFQKVEFKKSLLHSDSINISLITNLETYQIYNFNSRQYENSKTIRIIEIDDNFVDTLKDGFDIKFKIPKKAKKIRFKYINSEYQIDYSNKTFISEYLIIDDKNYSNINLVFNILPEYYNNNNLTNDTLLIISNKKLFNKRDSIFYYKNNKINRFKLRNVISYKE